MNKAIAGLSVLVVATLVVGASSLYTVNEAEQVLVLRFGNPQQLAATPGLKVKAPFIDDVVRYEKRQLLINPPAEQVILGDQKRIEVDSFTLFRIADPLVFYQAVRTEEAARQRLREVITSSLRRVLGNVMLPSVLSEERTSIMAEIQGQVNAEAKRFGMLVSDVRIRRADLPDETSQSIYERMRSERERQAREARAQGQERAQQIRSRAERERTVILAEAQRQSQILRGEGDAQANRIYAQAFSQDPKFFDLYRSLQAYREALGDGSTSLVLSPDSDFFRFFGSMPGGNRGANPPPARTGRAE